MNKVILTGCLAAAQLLLSAGTAFAGTTTWYVDTGKYSSWTYKNRYYPSDKSSKRIRNNCWGWSYCASGAWHKMTFDTSSLNKNWTVEYDCKNERPDKVKCWSALEQLMWKKNDANFKGSIAANFTLLNGNGGNYYVNMQAYAEQKSDRKGWVMDLMIRPDYSGSRSYWTRVWVDGQEWYKRPTEWTWSEDGKTVRRCRTVYAKKNKTRNHKVNVKRFMDHMGCKDWYVYELSFGWEAIQGYGKWKVNSVSLNQ
jgi:hypothetical protein